MEETRVCDICGREHPLSELKEFGGVLLCESCWNSETIVCSQCGKRIWLDDNEGDSETPLCSRCYDRYYTTCTDCGRTIHQDDAYYIDEDDYDARCYTCHCRHADHRVIHDYYYKPEPIFYGEGKRYFGVELEIDGAGESNANAAKLVEIANNDRELVYIKHDGSLDDGMEIVTHPTGDHHCGGYHRAVLRKMTTALAATMLEAFAKGAALAVSVYLIWKQDGNQPE